MSISTPTMNTKKCTVTHTQVLCRIAFILLLCVPLTTADDLPQKKNVFSKILGRFTTKRSDSNVVQQLQSHAIEEVSNGGEKVIEGNDVCTLDSSCPENEAAKKVESETVANVPIDTSKEPPVDSSTEDITKEGIESQAKVELLHTDTTFSWEDYMPSNQHRKFDPTTYEPTCIDLHENCPAWASQIDPQTNLTPCSTRAAYMSHYCAVSCDTCVLVHIDKRLRELASTVGESRIDPHCSDENFDCVVWAKAGECDKNPSYMYEACRSSCGVCSEKSNYFGSGQRTMNGNKQELEVTMQRIDDTAEYMKKVNSDPDYKNVRSRCFNRHKDCTFWWAVGECTINADFMNMMCAPTCQTCDLLPEFGTE